MVGERLKMLKDRDEAFTSSLTSLHNDVDQAIQFFLIHDATFSSIKKDKRIEDQINTYRRYWNFLLHGLQAGLFLSLGRLFDTNGGHGFRRTFALAKAQRSMFSISSISLRKSRAGLTDSEVKTYMEGKVDLSGEYLDRLAEYAEEFRIVYGRACKKIRDEIFAHSTSVNHQQKIDLFQQLNEEEIFNLIAFAKSMLDALLSLYYNGTEVRIPFNLPAFDSGADDNSEAIKSIDSWELTDQVRKFLNASVTV